MGKKLSIYKKDILKTVYFISNLTQMQGSRPMQGALSSKGDYMGGIFDRWINIIPESVLFNKIILPKVKSKEPISVITDYYDYNPKKVGIAPDVIGIRVGKKAIPFVVFKNEWTPVSGCPQIEVKTFKKTQKMVSLRNQDYDEKYLVLAETNFRVDYLIPIISKEFFDEEVYNSLHMDDDVFIISNEENKIQQSKMVDVSNDRIGEVDLLQITTAEDFMKMATKYEPNMGIEYFSGIDEYKGNRKYETELGKLSAFGSIQKNTLFRFEEKWYSHKNKDKCIRDKKKCKTIDCYVSNPEEITVLSICKSKLKIKANKNCVWETTELTAGKIYDISLTQMKRGAGEEYFILKSAIPHLKDCEAILLDHLQKTIKLG